MGNPIVRYVYDRRNWIKPLIPVRRPLRIRLREFMIYVSPMDWAVGARIAIRRRYEPHISAVLRELIEPGYVVVDIGANIGYHTLLAAARTGEGGRVISFEPGDQNRVLLRRSLEVNRFQNVLLHPYAVSEVEGIVGYRTDDSNGRIDLAPAAESPFQVESVTLDAFLRDEPRIDLVKIDIEGAEGRALRGMREMLLRHHPIIVTEFTPNAMPEVSGMTGEAYLAELRDLGYELFMIYRDRPRDPYPQTDQQIFSALSADLSQEYLDLLAIAPET